jgi:uncharacterized protein YktB (UPF0637 family)
MVDYTVPFTKKSFEDFTTALNHRMTSIEGDVKWLKKIGYYMAAILSVGIGKVVFFS